MRRDVREGEKEREKTHPADRGGGKAAVVPSACLRRPAYTTEEERMWPDKMERERERKI